MGQCGGYRLPPTLRDPTANKHYSGGYLNVVKCLLDPGVGVEYLFSGDTRLGLAHHEIIAQGEMVLEPWKSVLDSAKALARYTELKSATSCQGTSTPITMLPYTDASTFF